MMDPGDRLKLARERRGYATAADFARRFNIGESIHTHRENKTRGISRDAAKQYAKSLRISLDWLLDGVGEMDGRKRLAPLGGIIGAGAEVFPIDDTGGRGYEQVEAPPDSSEATVALRIKGDSMYPAYYDGDLIFYEVPQRPQDCLGLECVLELADGRRLLKVLTRGAHKDTYTLVSHNAPPIPEAKLNWAAPVTWVKRGGHRNPHAVRETPPADLPLVKPRRAHKK